MHLKHCRFLWKDNSKVNKKYEKIGSLTEKTFLWSTSAHILERAFRILADEMSASLETPL